MGADDSHDLKRFTCAQTGIYARALAEVRAGDKRSHWMWFIFPQVCGLGSTPTARRYAIKVSPRRGLTSSISISVRAS